MKKLFYILFFLLITHNSALITPSFAHLAGQQPFFKLDGAYSILYPVPTTSLEDFALPQDLAVGNFLVNQPIFFEFDVGMLPAPPEVVAKTTFYWDFGDGASGSGLQNRHTYTKVGSYIIVIDAETADSPRQVIQSTMVHVLPNKDYKLPESIIQIEGKTSKDPLTDPIRLKFSGPLSLDGSDSKSLSSKINSYFWDFGDKQTSTESKVSHQYKTESYNTIVVLRVKDANGLIGDSYAEIINEEDNAAKQATRAVVQTAAKGESLAPKIITGGVVLLVVALGILFWKQRKRRK